MQACFTAFEQCAAPVVAAVHGAAYGAAVDLLTCCDLRYCTTDAIFCVKAVNPTWGGGARMRAVRRLPALTSLNLTCCLLQRDAEQRYTSLRSRLSTSRLRRDVYSSSQVDVGITADVGTLQRLPGIVGDGVARELCLTARPFDGAEALRLGFVAAALPSAAALFAKVCVS
jgi:enoyl-CoA hydratase/carnithine racemase